jgi:uncharacterized protein
MKLKPYSRSAALLPILFLFFSVHVFSQGFAKERIVDNADLLSDSQKSELTNLINTISEAHNFDLVIVTETSILGRGKSPMEFADDFFDYNGYGLGENRDGCVFLRVVNSRDYRFSTSGRGIKVLNPTALGHLESATGKYLTGNNFYEAARAYIQTWDKFLDLEAKGRNFNFFYRWNILLVLISWLVALVIGLIVISGWKQGMNTARLKTQAAAYIITKSLNFTVKKDSFLFSKVEKVKQDSQQTSLSGNRGVHTSSSGRTHGGGGGKK